MTLMDFLGAAIEVVLLMLGFGFVAMHIYQMLSELHDALTKE